MGINGPPTYFEKPNPAEMAKANERMDAEDREQAAKEAGWDDVSQAALMTELMNAQEEIVASDKGFAKEIRAALKASLAGETVDLAGLRDRAKEYKRAGIGEDKLNAQEVMYVAPEEEVATEEVPKAEQVETAEKNDLWEDQDYMEMENALGALIAYGDVLNHVADKDLWDSGGNVQITAENANEQFIIDQLIAGDKEYGWAPQDTAKKWLAEYEETVEKKMKKLEDKKFTSDTSTLDSAKDEWNKYQQKRQVVREAA